MDKPEILRDHNAHTYLVFRVARVKMYAIALSAPVRVVRLDKAERRYMTPLIYKGKPYPLARAIRHLRVAGKELGITKGARAVLNGLRKGSRHEPVASE